MQIIFGFIGIVIVVWFAWYLGGGEQRYKGTEGPYLKAPAPLDTGESYGN